MSVQYIHVPAYTKCTHTHVHMYTVRALLSYGPAPARLLADVDPLVVGEAIASRLLQEMSKSYQALAVSDAVVSTLSPTP